MKKEEIMEIIAPLIKGNELWKSYPFGMTALGENLVEALHQALSISRFSIEERFRLEEKLVKMVTDKRPYYKTVKKRGVVRDTVSDLLDAIIQNGL
jgi:hypothetical protein